MAARLTESQSMLVIRAATLLNGYCALLSDHERDLVDAVTQRFRRDGRDMAVTAHEWPVIEDAVTAMEVARQRPRDAPKPWTNGDPMQGRARIPCACGGTMYDWGVGPASSHRPTAGDLTWVIDWKCQGGCGRGIGHLISNGEIHAIRNGDQDVKDREASKLVGRESWDAWPSLSKAGA